MPDLVLTSFWRCDREYRKHFASTSDGSVVYHAYVRGLDAHCTCPGWQYHQKCRHVDELFREACMWNEHWNSMGLQVMSGPGGGNEELVCPNCGGRVASFADAV